VTIRISFGRIARATRLRLDITQQQLAAAVGLSRGYIARIECGTANPTFTQVERIADVLGIELALVATPPIFLGEGRSRDQVHSRCVAYTQRRLERHGWRVAREVEVSRGRFHAWIDLLAFDPRTGGLLIIEVKTRLDDIGALERQLGWYERYGPAAAERLGWRPQSTGTWLLALSSDEIDRALREHQDTFQRDIPVRARVMLDVARGAVPPAGRGLALIDPTSRRQDWLIRTRSDGRRSAASFLGYADAAHRLQIDP
jgi:transcriptional regulator with XRE-family HTH domain